MLASTLLRRTLPASVRFTATRGFLSDVPMGPPDPILGLTEAFNNDDFPKKVSLGVGAYRDNENKPFVLDVVRKAEQMLVDQKCNHEYLGITGLAGFNELSLKFAYGEDSPVLAENRVAATQTLSGTGSLRLAAEFFNKFNGAGSQIYVPNPTWGNHIPINANAGLDVQKYRYLDDKGTGLDFAGMVDDVRAAPDNSVFLFHACAHNPTGVDPTEAQWDELSEVVKAKGHFCFFDCAYQGFATGDAERDAYSIRKFAGDGHSMALSQSYAKNFGLYGERIGCFSVVCADAEEAARVESQLKIIIRPMYSNPPVYGARLVHLILSDPELKAQWYDECKGMADRIIEMRHLLRSTLEGLGSERDWSHITSQIGMFCYTGISTEQVERMKSEFHIYLTGDGRISVAGVNSGNAEYIANALHEVTK